MIARNRTCAAIIALVVAAGVSAAETIEAGPFSVDVSPALAVRLNGAPLITGDRCAVLRGALVDSPVLVDGALGRVLRQGMAITTLSRKERSTLRREVVVTPEAVSITFELRAFGPTGGTHVEYDLLMPLGTLDGVPCTFTTGDPRSQRADAKATLNSGGTKVGEYAQREIVYGRFAFATGAVSMDFNPQGAWQGESNYGEPTSAMLWHDGRTWHFTLFCAGGGFGATLTGKIILRAGAIPYEQVHLRTPVAYTTGFPVALALNFSEGDKDDLYSACSTEAAADKPYRWRDPKAVRLVTRNAGGFLYRDHAAPAKLSGEGVFDMELPSGLYLLTLHGYDAEAPAGPFTVAGPAGVLFRDVRFARGAHWVRTAPLRVREGKAFLRFSGAWKVNALALQMILGDVEDFLFDRPFWSMALPPDGAPEVKR